VEQWPKRKNSYAQADYHNLLPQVKKFKVFENFQRRVGTTEIPFPQESERKVDGLKMKYMIQTTEEARNPLYT
jgi:hypothetical protein